VAAPGVGAECASIAVHTILDADRQNPDPTAPWKRSKRDEKINSVLFSF